MSWQTESPLWDLIDRNNKKIPRYDEIALVNVTGGAPTSIMNQKIENNRWLHKGKSFFICSEIVLINLILKCMNLIL